MYGRRYSASTTSSKNCAAGATCHPDAEHDVARLLDHLAERDARIAELTADPLDLCTTIVRQ